MPREPVREFVEFGGERYFRDPGPHGYWRMSWSRGGRLLHRDVYEAAHGPIPEGWHIHHRDGDRYNYDLDNLMALSPSKHKAAHPTKGRSFLSSEVRRRVWRERQPRSIECTGCGAVFQSTGRRAAFCSERCRRAFRRASA